MSGRSETEEKAAPRISPKISPTRAPKKYPASVKANWMSFKKSGRSAATNPDPSFSACMNRCKPKKLKFDEPSSANCK